MTKQIRPFCIKNHFSYLDLVLIVGLDVTTLAPVVELISVTLLIWNRLFGAGLEIGDGIGDIFVVDVPIWNGVDKSGNVNFGSQLNDILREINCDIFVISSSVVSIYDLFIVQIAFIFITPCIYSSGFCGKTIETDTF